MASYAINGSQRRAARFAGAAYLITFAIVVYVNFGIHDRLIVQNNVAETARSIMAHELIFRIGIAGDLIYCVGIIVLLSALYVILKPVQEGLALLAAFWRLVMVLMWLMATLNLFSALKLLKGAPYLQSFEPDRLQSMALLYLGLRFEDYYVGLLFGALASTACSYLWFKSRYIPQSLSVFGIVSSAFCVACTFVFYIFPDFDKTVSLWWFDLPMGIFDIVLSFWLIFSRLGPSESPEMTRHALERWLV